MGKPVVTSASLADCLEEVFLQEIKSYVRNDMKYFLPVFFPIFFPFPVGFSVVSLSTLVFLASVFSATEDVARLRAVEAVDARGDGWWG